MSQRRLAFGKKLTSAANNTAYEPISHGPNSANKQLPKSSAGKRIGRLGVVLTIAIVPGCTIAILLVVAYLTFIWFQTPGNEIWHHIVLSNWTTTSVAICGVILRWTTSFQSGLCTSILALNVLKNGSPLANIPRLSSLRFDNGGPLDFVFLLSWPKFKLREIYLFVLIILSISTTIMLQLSSTLLLSDLSTAPLQTFANYTSNALLAGEDRQQVIEAKYFSDAMRTTSPTYPLFAELSSASPFSGDSAIDDTGPSIRALLPVTSDDRRSRLLEFAGNATLYDARWICTRPILTDLNLVGSNLELYFSGNVNHSVYHAPMVPASPDTPPSFNCTLTSTRPGAWTIFSCNVNFDRNDVLQGVTNSVGNPVVNLTDNYRFVGFSWLILNVTDLNIPSAPNSSYYSGSLAFNNSDNFVVNPNGHWASITSTQQDSIIYSSPRNGTRNLVTSGGDWTFRIDASICSSAFTYTRNMYISAGRDHIEDEPVTIRTGKKQIGASQVHYNIQDRGILEINETEFQRQKTLPQNLLSSEELIGRTNNNNTLTSRLFIARPESTTTTIDDRVWYDRDDNLKCTTAESTYEQCPRLVHEDRVALFQNIITESNSPALAMQAMQHTLITDRFYRYMPNFQIPSTQELTHSVEAIQPIRNRGYIAVMTAICIHLFLVSNILIVLGILRGTKQTLSSVNQAWQTISQVALLQQELSIGSDKEDMLSSTTATDYQAEKHMADHGLQNKIYVLQEVPGESVVRFRAAGERAMADHDPSIPMTVMTRERHGSGQSTTSTRPDDHSTANLLPARTTQPQNSSTEEIASQQ